MDKASISLSFLALLIATFTAMRSASAGNGWVSGGADAVACFANASEKLQSIDESGKLRSLTRISHLQSFDLFENDQPKITLSASQEKALSGNNRVAQNQAFESTLQQMHLEWLSSPFARKLGDLQKKAPLSTWNFRNQRLENLDDAGDGRQLPDNCALVQVVIRNYRSSSNGLEVKFEVDADLFDRLAPLDKFAIALHEYLYVISGHLDHRDSSRTRKLVGLLLDETFHEQFWDIYVERGSDFRVLRAWFHSRLDDLELENYRQVFFQPLAGSSYDLRAESYSNLRLQLDELAKTFPGTKPKEKKKRFQAFLDELTDENALSFFLVVWSSKRLESSGVVRGTVDFIEEAADHLKPSSVDDFLGKGFDVSFHSYDQECDGLSVYLRESEDFEDPALEKDPLKRAAREVLTKAERFCKGVLAR